VSWRVELCHNFYTKSHRRTHTGWSEIVLIEDVWLQVSRNLYRRMLSNLDLFFFLLLVGDRQLKLKFQSCAIRNSDGRLSIRLASNKSLTVTFSPISFSSILFLMPYIQYSSFGGTGHRNSLPAAGKNSGSFRQIREKSTKSRKNLGLLSAVYPSQSGNNVPVKAYRPFLASGVWTLT
jgi:hypothetical protein